MKRLRQMALLLGVAMSLTAQQLSFGPLALVGSGPTKTMNVLLDPQGKSVAGLQFDLSYNTSALTISIALGSASTAAQMDLAFCGWGTGAPSPTCAYTGIVGSSSPPTGSGQRAVIIGCCATGQSVPTSNAFANVSSVIDVVAVLSITPTAAANSGNQTITLTNASGTGLGGNMVAPVSYNPLSIANGTANMYVTYLVGDVYPFTSDTAPNFGSGTLSVLEVVQMLYGVDGLAPLPAKCSDRYDAMDTYPVDGATGFGGDGTINVLDVVEELYRVDSLDKSRPVRPSLSGACEPGPAAIRTARSSPRPQVENYGRLQFGTPEPIAGGTDRVPVYLRATRDMARVALTFGVGDQRSQLRFVSAGAAPFLPPSDQVGVLAPAWLEGLNAHAGESVLLGYVTGPTGYAAGLKVFGVSAGGLNDGREMGLEVSGVTVAQQ